MLSTDLLSNGSSYTLPVNTSKLYDSQIATFSGEGSIPIIFAAGNLFCYFLHQQTFSATYVHNCLVIIKTLQHCFIPKIPVPASNPTLLILFSLIKHAFFLKLHINWHNQYLSSENATAAGTDLHSLFALSI